MMIDSFSGSPTKISGGMNLLFSRSVWIKALCTALAFTLCAIAVRFYWGYPRCRNDELNWIDIARTLDTGQEWPVSGPSFVYVLRNMKEMTRMQYSELISGLGIVSVFVGSLLIILGYSRLKISKPGATLIALALSSYFWAPLLEARPQQWGQIHVFVGSICAWFWLHKRGGWLFFPVLILASFSHILSHAILVFICATLALADYFENRPMNRRHAILIASLLLSLIVYVLPSGPYQTMLSDIEGTHLRRLLVAMPYLGAAALMTVFAIVALKPRLHWRSDWSNATRAYALAHQNVICATLLVIFSTVISIQAWVLPPDSWLPYGGSVWTFVVFQSGNLVFALLFVVGIFHFLRDIANLKIEASNARMLVWSLASFGMLGLATLAASFFMLNTNWLLRLINYAILFAAPVAAITIGNSNTLRKYPWLYLLTIPLFIISICQAIRPTELLSC